MNPINLKFTDVGVILFSFQTNFAPETPTHALQNRLIVGPEQPFFAERPTRVSFAFAAGPARPAGSFLSDS